MLVCFCVPGTYKEPKHAYTSEKSEYWYVLMRLLRIETTLGEAATAFIVVHLLRTVYTKNENVTPLRNGRAKIQNIFISRGGLE